MDKKKQFDDFLEKLKKEKSIIYSFSIGWTWVQYHNCYERLNGDWIEGVSERFIDGDNGSEEISIIWKYDEKENLISIYELYDNVGYEEKIRHYELNFEREDLLDLFDL